MHGLMWMDIWNILMGGWIKQFNGLMDEWNILMDGWMDGRQQKSSSIFSCSIKKTNNNFTTCKNGYNIACTSVMLNNTHGNYSQLNGLAAVL